MAARLLSVPLIFNLYLNHLRHRYGEWHEMQRQFSELLRKDDRMLKDIGLSRADVIRITQGQNFWEHMSRPEDCKNRCNGDSNDYVAPLGRIEIIK